MGEYEKAVEEWLGRLEKNSLVPRIWRRDPSVWKRDPKEQKEIARRLGWLELAVKMRPRVAELKAFAEEIRAAGFTKVLLLGMGGSSLAPEVFQKIFGNAPGFPNLLVLDSTDPDRVRDIEKSVDLASTLFIVSSKSGGTVELVSFFKYFFEKVKALKGESAGGQFIAITDPGTPLEELAKRSRFRRVFLAPEDVGGRFSALSVFGLVPASLIGVDLAKVLSSAERMMRECAADAPLGANSAARLGVAMAVLAEEGRDKLTILAPPPLESFGDWAEQLVAESTGKEEMGIIPVVREEWLDPPAYGNDRFFVALLPAFKKDAAFEEKLRALESTGHPVLRLRWKEASDLGGEFFRWEMATAVAAALMKINAFDQPDVQAAKDRTQRLLKETEPGRALEAKSAGPSLEDFWAEAEEGDYAAILAFLPDREEFTKKLFELRNTISRATKMAVTVGFGPRYLHSTGQLHKGGPNKALFILITSPTTEDLAVPGEPYTFGQLELAQAMGDFEALESRGRWLVHVRLEHLSEEHLAKCCADILKALKAGVK